MVQQRHVITAVIIGIAGQDGSYLAELLIAKGYRVIGAVRDIPKAQIQLSGYAIDGVELVEFDMLNQQRMVEIFTIYRPHEIYNFAAYSSGAGMFEDVIDIGDVNGLAVARILEAIRLSDVDTRFCQASSSEVFGDPIESPQSENSIFRPRSPYGAAKLYADSMVRIYRKRYGLFTCSAILFNHESPRRGVGFVTRKITQGAAKIKLGISSEIQLGNLDARRDWGFAGDYVSAMWLMLQQSQANDYILATGKTYSVRDLCDIAFEHLGLDYRDYVREDASAFRPNEAVQLVGDASKARNELSWEPKITFREMICNMVDSDLRMLQNYY